MKPDQETTHKSWTAAPRKLKQHGTRLLAAPAIKKSHAELRNMMLELIEKGEALEANIRTILGEDSLCAANDVRTANDEHSVIEFAPWEAKQFNIL